MAPDMWTGWGIRTLSADHLAFNPYNYQTGSVAARQRHHRQGFKFYGLVRKRRGLRMTSAWRRATFCSISCRSFTPPPSAPRRTSRFSISARTCPGAWAAGSVFMLTQALLGFLPDAPRDKLYVDPSLPAWLPDLTVRDLRIGKHKPTSGSGPRAGRRHLRSSRRSQGGRALRHRVQGRALRVTPDRCGRRKHRRGERSTLPGLLATGACQAFPVFGEQQRQQFRERRGNCRNVSLRPPAFARHHDDFRRRRRSDQAPHHAGALQPRQSRQASRRVRHHRLRPYRPDHADEWRRA